MLDTVLVGCGKAGESHVREIQKLGRARLLAVCDSEPLMAEQLAARLGVPRFYSDFEVMLERERPQLVHVTTPPQSHLALATHALDVGCHVLVEKPLTLTHADAVTMLEHATRCNRLLTIGYGFYFDPISRTMRRLIADGVLGDPVHVESFMGYSLEGQFGAPVVSDSGHWVHELPGKLLHNVIDHILNKVTEFVPSDRPNVTVRAWQHADFGTSAISLPDEVRMMISDERVSAYATFTAHARPLSHYLNVFGTRNTIQLDFLAGTLTMRSSSALPGAFGRIASSFDQSLQHLREGGRNILRFARADFQYMAGLAHLIAAFHDSILCDAPLPISYREILRVSALADQVFAQMRLPQLHRV